MAYPNIFEKQVTDNVIARIDKISNDSKPNWGKMNSAQMLAHCCVTYEMMFDNNIPKPGAIKRFLLNAFVKKAVVSETPYPKNSRTAPQFIIADERDFNKEKARLLTYMNKTQEIGSVETAKSPSHSFGMLTENEWNNMLYKHLDHHLGQFGV